MLQFDWKFEHPSRLNSSRLGKGNSVVILPKGVPRVPRDRLFVVVVVGGGGGGICLYFPGLFDVRVVCVEGSDNRTWLRDDARTGIKREGGEKSM